jgi:nucleoside phosphorylase
MDKEAKPIISMFNLKKWRHSFSPLPMQGFIGKFKNIDILYMINGIDPIYHVQNVGTEAATLTTYLGIEHFHPGLVISIGTAGGVKKNGAQINDIYVSKKIYFYDRRIQGKGYYQYGIGDYSSLVISSINNKVGLKLGIVCSGDSFDENKTDYQMFIKENCSAIDMEAAGVAWVSMLMHTPMLAIKGITNFVNDNQHDEYQKNFSSVIFALTNKLKTFLNNLTDPS